MHAGVDREDGSALVLALIWMVVFSILTGGLLASAASNQRLSQRLSENDDELLAADSGINTAVTHIRTDLTGELGTYPASAENCPLDQPLLSFEEDQALSGYDVQVFCVPLDQSGVPVFDPSLPAYSALVLDDMVMAGAAATVRFQGDVHVNYRQNSDPPPGLPWLNFGDVGPLISVDDGDFEVADTLWNSGPGNPCGSYNGDPPNEKLEIVAEGTVTCGSGDYLADPNWPEPFTWEPAQVAAFKRTVPSCASRVPAGDGIHYLLTFQPGFYDDGPGLAQLFDGSCSNTIFWFGPDWSNPDPDLRGNYLFDLQGLTNGTLQITDPTAQIIGGEPQGWVPGVSMPSFPGACMLEGDYEDAGVPSADRAGVVFMFAGETNMSQDAGKLELCPQPSTTLNEVSVYQLKDDYPSGGAGLDSGTAVGRNASSSYFSNAGNAYYDDGAVASWRQTCASLLCVGLAQNRDLTVFQMDASDIPQGELTSATVRVETPSAPNVTINSVTVDVTLGDGQVCNNAVSRIHLLPGTDLETWDLVELCRDIPLIGESKLVSGSQLENASVHVIYNANWAVGRNTTFGIDTDLIDLQASGPSPYMRGQVDTDGCPVHEADNDHILPVCPVIAALQTDTTTEYEFAVHGSVYVPRGGVRAFAHFNYAPAYRRGVVAERLYAVKVQQAGVAGPPLISVPNPEALDRDVILLAFARPSDGSGDWHLRLEVLAHFYDGDGSSLGEAVDIKYYKVCRLETEPSGTALCPIDEGG
ncbi:MAG: hypothetical protein EDR02_13360 [Actinobacteria bacterium]|nr:MAG: hypothetical protein EDR02_13360 [Actinomycetota bacterium]RIK02587.1 MAG: hypothetical protein DCC48_17935 [Acidobacteriota bacterium]